MKKTCSIRLLVAGVILTAFVCVIMGFFFGTQKKWKTYEKRIVMLEQENDNLLAQKEKIETEKELAESLNVVEPYKYVLLAEEGYVAVYRSDRKTLYASTDILLENLPEELQQEIQTGKLIGSEEQLYNFLENYSS